MEFTVYAYICNDNIANYTHIQSWMNETISLITDAVGQVVDDEERAMNVEGVQLVTNGECII
jgi:hypothetical protein